ncbi:hypothetical protein ACY2DA_08985 [Staphylococcus simulans]
MNKYLDFDYNLGNHLYEQLTRPIKTMQKNLESQTNFTFRIVKNQNLLSENLLKSIRNSQNEFCRQISELTNLPDLPDFSNIINTDNIFKNISDKVKNMRIIIQDISPEYIESQVNEVIDDDIDLIDEFSKFSEQYQSQILDNTKPQTFERVQNVINTACSAFFRFSINMTGIYIPESHRIILNKYFDKSNHYLTQVSNSMFQTWLLSTFNELFNYPLPPNLFTFIFTFLFLLTFVIDYYKYKNNKK